MEAITLHVHVTVLVDDQEDFTVQRRGQAHEERRLA